MSNAVNRQVLLIKKPEGKLGPEHFQMSSSAVPKPGEGEVLIRTKLISLDAANRAWMQGATYRSEVLAGAVMAGGGVAEVVESRAEALKPGDIVFAETGWQEYSVTPARNARKLPKVEPLTHLISVFGIAGLTAYFGLLEHGKPKAGETVVISAAAGSVGSIAGQIAKIKGCHVVGIAGGKEKCDWLTGELGFDAAVDYKAPGAFKALKAAAPKGIDVYFDNVGGEILEMALAQMNTFGRISCCGAISQYETSGPTAGPRGIPGVIVFKRLTMQGFIVTDHFKDAPRAIADLGGWLTSGQLKIREEVTEGLENTPQALIGLLNGANRGKVMVRVS